MSHPLVAISPSDGFAVQVSVDDTGNLTIVMSQVGREELSTAPAEPSPVPSRLDHVLAEASRRALESTSNPPKRGRGRPPGPRVTSEEFAEAAALLEARGALRNAGSATPGPVALLMKSLNPLIVDAAVFTLMEIRDRQTARGVVGSSGFAVTSRDVMTITMLRSVAYLYAAVDEIGAHPQVHDALVSTLSGMDYRDFRTIRPAAFKHGQSFPRGIEPEVLGKFIGIDLAALRAAAV